MFESVERVVTDLEKQGYVCDRRIATVVFLAQQLGKPVLSEGPAGVGKTELAKVVALAAGERITYTGTIASCINDVVTLSTDAGDATVHLDDIISAQLVHQEYKIDKKRSKEKRSKKRRGGS